ncbi:hypothetical protein [Stieleria varia]|nr:hypothetical protein [Stieleria varia]
MLQRKTLEQLVLSCGPEIILKPEMRVDVGYAETDKAMRIQTGLRFQ